MLEDILGLSGLSGATDDAAQAVPVDIDGDGIIDGFLYQEMRDIDGDGVVDEVVSELHLDLDHDGLTDIVQTEIAMDTDGDGILEELGGLGFTVSENSADAPAYETFDPSDADEDFIFGNPEEAMENWHCQETGSSCAVASQEFILEQLTGHSFEEGDLRDLAEEHGWYIPDGGTPMDDIGNLLEYMGLQVEQSRYNTIEDIRTCLEQGGRVLVSVDSDELWYGQNDDLFGPGMDADHAVQVIGIDNGHPDGPMVILNDPGVGNGSGAMVSVENFMDAWEDSGCFMVEAYAPE